MDHTHAFGLREKLQGANEIVLLRGSHHCYADDYFLFNHVVSDLKAVNSPHQLELLANKWNGLIANVREK